MDDDDLDAKWGPRVDITHIAAQVHPGDLLRDCIDGNASTVSGTARLLGVSRATLSRVLAGQGPMTPRMAVALERMGWSEATFWMALQAQHDIAKVRLGTDAA